MMVPNLLFFSSALLLYSGFVIGGFSPVSFGLVPLAIIKRGELGLEMKEARGECQRCWAIKGFL